MSWRQTSGRKLSHQPLTFKKKFTLQQNEFSSIFHLKYDGREGVIFDKSIVSLLPSFSSYVLLVRCLHLCCSYPCKAKAEGEMLFRLQMFQFKILSLSKREWICWKGVDYFGNKKKKLFWLKKNKTFFYWRKKNIYLLIFPSLHSIAELAQLCTSAVPQQVVVGSFKSNYAVNYML